MGIKRDEFELTEGVDYIVDYYAILGVQRGAAEEEISSVLRQKQAENHPDRVGMLGPEIQALAERNMCLFSRTEDILLADPERKKQYDDILTEFASSKPKLISTNGQPILSLSERRIMPQFLLDGGQLETGERLREFTAAAHHDEANVGTMKGLFESDAKNPLFRELYRKALLAKLNYLDLVEEMA